MLQMCVSCRSFTARPIYSTDDPNVDKHKLERFLHDKRQCVATIYGPIQYPPLPLLAFKITSDQPPQLAMAGDYRCNQPQNSNINAMFAALCVCPGNMIEVLPLTCHPLWHISHLLVKLTNFVCYEL